MKIKMNVMMLLASVIAMMGCTADDPVSERENNMDNPWSNGGEQTTPQGDGNSETTGELTTFSIGIDKTSSEPTDAAEPYFPDEEDMLENNTFKTEVYIDLSNPMAKNENGVEVTVNGGHITANHGSVSASPTPTRQPSTCSVANVPIL